MGDSLTSKDCELEVFLHERSVKTNNKTVFLIKFKCIYKF
jgi:hypothetical protein